MGTISGSRGSSDGRGPGRDDLCSCASRWGAGCSAGRAQGEFPGKVSFCGSVQALGADPTRRQSHHSGLPGFGSAMKIGALLLAVAITGLAHEGQKKPLKPTKAKADLEKAKKQLDQARKNAAAEGKFSCCVKPGCSLCLLTQGSCSCAANAAKVKGVSAKSITLAPSPSLENRDAAVLAHAAAPDLGLAIASLARAKATLVSEQRFSCCIRGGCTQCAMEGDCTCADDLSAAPEKTSRKKSPSRKGFCGDCVDGWKAGKGRLAGIDPSEVTLADVSSMDTPMGPASSTAQYSSGTSQVPGSTPMSMLTHRLGPWNLALHGEGFAIYSAESGPRGRDKIFSTNWVMGEASRRLGPGTLALHGMFSLEPATITGRQYPLLFQEGETANGVPIINGQHPHDAIMELAASYQLPLGENASFTLYGGPRGEPALGPPAYPHRISASEDPVAPLGHHQQDSTHILDDVVTAGVNYRWVTLEASGFHGREPDEFRWGLEQGGIDSFSARVTVTPTSRWSAQFSGGRLNRVEATHPLRPDFRMTGSVMYVRPLARGHWATMALWGRNVDLSYTQTPGLPPPIPHALQPRHVVSVPTRIPPYIYNSYLIESTLRFKDSNWIWGRAENVDRDSLVLFQESPLTLLVDEQRYARVQAYTAGYERELPRRYTWLSTGLGGQFTLFHAPPDLAPIFNTNPVGVQLFLRLRLGKI